MRKDEKALEEMLERIGLTSKWEKRGEARGVALGEARGVALGEARGAALGEARGAALGEAKGKQIGWEKAIGLLKEGYTVDQLEQMSRPFPAEN